MNITDVRVRKVNDEGKMKAVVSITFDDEFVVHDIKLSKDRTACLLQCLARKWEKAISEISHTLFFLKHATESRMQYLQSTKRFLPKRKKKQNKTVSTQKELLHRLLIAGDYLCSNSFVLVYKNAASYELSDYRVINYNRVIFNGSEKP